MSHRMSLTSHQIERVRLSGELAEAQFKQALLVGKRVFGVDVEFPQVEAIAHVIAVNYAATAAEFQAAEAL